MLVLLMLGEVEALDLLGAGECHAHLSVFFILISILFFHLTNLRMLSSLDLTLVHELIVVLLLLLLLILTSLFAAFVILIVVLLLLLIAFALLTNIARLLIESTTALLLIILSCLLSDLYDRNLPLVIKITRYRTCGK